MAADGGTRRYDARPTRTPRAQHLGGGLGTTRQLCQPDPDALFVKGKAQRSAKLVCRSCPVVAECLADALDSRTDFGVWGG